MKKSQTKSKQAANSQQPKSPKQDASPVSNNYLKIENKNSRYNISRVLTTRHDNLNSMGIFPNRYTNSKSPSSNTNRIQFLKHKVVNYYPREVHVEENSGSLTKSKPNVNSSSRKNLDRTDNSSFNNSKGSLSPRNRSSEGPREPIPEEENSVHKLKKQSPSHVKSCSAIRPIVAHENFAAPPVKKNGSGSGYKVGSMTSLENLMGSNSMLSRNPSLLSSKAFNFQSKEFEESTYVPMTSITLEKHERCVNHPHKKAKYYVVSETEAQDEQYKYCSKCAIKLAGNGVKVKEILSSDEALRKSELEEFLIKLSDGKRNLHNFLSVLHRKKEDLAGFFNRQEEKIENIYTILGQIIEEEKKRKLDIIRQNRIDANAEMEAVENDMCLRLEDATKIQYDIDNNMQNIVRNVALEPFKVIISQYEIKLQQAEEAIENYKNQQLLIYKLPKFDDKIVEKMKGALLSFYNPIKLLTSVIKRSEFDSNKKITPQNDIQVLDKGSIHISFENKEIFENAIEQSSSRGVNDSRNELKAHLSAINNAHNTAIKIDDDAVYPAHQGENFQEFQNRSTVKGPQEQKKATDPIISPFMNTKTPNKPPLDPHQMQRSSRHTSKSSDKDFETDSYIENKENIPPNENTPGMSHHKNTKKYMNILDKISANQSKKKEYYSRMIQNNPLISPRLPGEDSVYEEGAQTSKRSKGTDRYSEDILDEDRIPGYLTFEKTSTGNSPFHPGSHPFGTPLVIEQRTEHLMKGQRHFESMSLSDNKAPEEKRYSLQPSFQKTLFCSPNFKENIPNNTHIQSFGVQQYLQYYYQLIYDYPSNLEGRNLHFYLFEITLDL